MVFNSVWSLLVLLYVGVTPLYMTSIFHKLAALVLNVLTTLFWFAGSIALAVQLGGPTIAAAVAFGFFLWCVKKSLLGLLPTPFQRSNC
jgi:CBS-domain-containing membrane protein